MVAFPSVYSDLQRAGTSEILVLAHYWVPLGLVKRESSPPPRPHGQVTGSTVSDTKSILTFPSPDPSGPFLNIVPKQLYSSTPGPSAHLSF